MHFRVQIIYANYLLYKMVIFRICKMQIIFHTQNILKNIHEIMVMEYHQEAKNK